MELKVLTGQEAKEVPVPADQYVPWPDDSLVVLALEDGKVVGRTAAIVLPHIEGTWVSEAHRHGTLGFRLVKKLEEELNALGRSHAFAFILDSQPELAAYMERMEYRKFPVSVWVKEIK